VRGLQTKATLLLAVAAGCANGPREAALDPPSASPAATTAESAMVPPTSPGSAARIVRGLASAKASDETFFIYERAAGGSIDTLRVDGRPGGAQLSFIKKRPDAKPQIWRVTHTGDLPPLEAAAAADVWSRTYDQERRPASIQLAFLFHASDGKDRFEKRMFGSLPAELKPLTEQLEGLMLRCEKEGVLAGAGPRKKGIGKGPPIGDAKMRDDGTIVLDLRAELPGGGHGLAREEYPRGHPDYADILEHLGGLRPGESKLVPPWPE
jgi:hypothetical protein